MSPVKTFQLSNNIKVSHIPGGYTDSRLLESGLKGFASEGRNSIVENDIDSEGFKTVKRRGEISEYSRFMLKAKSSILTPNFYNSNETKLTYSQDTQKSKRLRAQF